MTLVSIPAPLCGQGRLPDAFDFTLNVVNLAPPLFANAFTGGSIDAAIGWAPYSIMQSGDVKVVSWDAEYGGVCPSVNAFRPAFLEKYPDVPLRMLRVQADTTEPVRHDRRLAIDDCRNT